MLTVNPSSGLATVNVAEGVSPGVVQKIFESVLNGSRYLDVSFHQVNVPKVERCIPERKLMFACLYIAKSLRGLTQTD